MVPRRGLEPPLSYPNMHLKHARLPIPPPRHEMQALKNMACQKGGRTLLISGFKVNKIFQQIDDFSVYLAYFKN